MFIFLLCFRNVKTLKTCIKLYYSMYLCIKEGIYYITKDAISDYSMDHLLQIVYYQQDYQQL